MKTGEQCVRVAVKVTHQLSENDCDRPTERPSSSRPTLTVVLSSKVFPLAMESVTVAVIEAVSVDWQFFREIAD